MQISKKESWKAMSGAAYRFMGIVLSLGMTLLSNAISANDMGLDISGYTVTGDAKAAAMLRTHLEQTGAWRPGTAQGAIAVVQDDTLPLETMRVTVADGKVTIIGNPVRWAVYEFLGRKLGVRFLWPGDCGTAVPSLSRIVISRETIDYRPALLRRDFRQSRAPEAVQEWTDKHYLSKERTPKGLSWGHAFHDWYEKYAASRPELFAVNPQGGNTPISKDTGRAKLRISSPAVLAAIREEYVRRGRPAYFCISPTDSAGYDTSPESMAMDPAPYSKEDVWAGKVDLTDRHVKYFNSVLAELRKENPRVQIGTYAYAAYRNPPKTVRLTPDAFHVQMVPSWYPEDYPIWQAWGEQAAAMYLRPNWPWNGGSSPFYPLHKIGAWIEFAYANKMQGFEVDSLTGFFGMRAPFYYLIVRKMAHPEISTDAILEEFYSSFGAARDEIRAYVMYWEDYSEKMAMPSSAGGGQGGDPNGLYLATMAREKLPDNPLAGSWYMMPYLYTDEIIQPAMDILLRARAKATGADRERVQYLIDAYVPYKKQRELMATVIDYRFRSKNQKLKARIDTLVEEYLAAHRKMYGNAAFGPALYKWVTNGTNLTGM